MPTFSSLPQINDDWVPFKSSVPTFYIAAMARPNLCLTFWLWLPFITSTLTQKAESHTFVHITTNDSLATELCSCLDFSSSIIPVFVRIKSVKRPERMIMVFVARQQSGLACNIPLRPSSLREATTTIA